jgi:hypothetical protein
VDVFEYLEEENKKIEQEQEGKIIMAFSTSHNSELF